MSWFESNPVSVAERVRSLHEPVPIPTLGGSILRGALGFTVVSIAGFVPWAVFGRWFYRQIGEAGLYAVCAVVFLGLSGPLLHRLLIGPGSMVRFYKVFTTAFIAYAVLWTIGWMSLRGHTGSVVGLLAGAMAMGAVLAFAFDAWRSVVKIVAALFLLNAAGYFIGGWVEAALPNVLGKLLWGVCYGLGFGAGLGFAFHECQCPLRKLLSNTASAAG